MYHRTSDYTYAVLSKYKTNTIAFVSIACRVLQLRSFSALRRLKTWNRSTMTESRLCVLVMHHIHRNDDVGHIECVEVLKRWDSSGHRKVALAFDKA